MIFSKLLLEESLVALQLLQKQRYWMLEAAAAYVYRVNSIQIICVPPMNPPGGVLQATVLV